VYLSMDFTDVELPVLIKFMSEQTKKNFIFDERVQGKITIISPRRVTLDEAYDVFLYVLQAKGFTTVTQGTRSRSSPPGKRARTRSTPASPRIPPPGVHHPPRSAAVPRERRGRPAGDAAGLQGRDGLRVRILQHAAADRLARQLSTGSSRSSARSTARVPRGPSCLPVGLRRRRRRREDLDFHIP